MKPLYLTLKQNHYSAEESSKDFVGAEKVYEEIGYNRQDLLRQSADYGNTCATRMSLALLKSHISFRGRLPIKSGKYKDQSVEPGSKLLADQLALPHAFGKPAVYTPQTILKKISGKRGVIFFWKIHGYGGGHIDLIDFQNGVATCHSFCFFESKEIWFWELK